MPSHHEKRNCINKTGATALDLLEPLDRFVVKITIDDDRLQRSCFSRNASCDLEPMATMEQRKRLEQHVAMKEEVFAVLLDLLESSPCSRVIRVGGIGKRIER